MQTGEGFRIRAGRFLPAFGVRFADHTAYTRSYLDLDRNDQVYGVEVSDAIGPSLVQVMVSPGKAEAVLHDHDRRGFSTAGRWQFDLAPRAAIVGSAFYRHSTNVDPQSGAVGGAFGVRANVSRVDLDGSRRRPADEGSGRAPRAWWSMRPPSRCVAAIWLKFSPQFRTAGGAQGSTSLRRLEFAADLLPRTHWHVNVSYYHDHAFAASTSALLAQLHLFM